MNDNLRPLEWRQETDRINVMVFTGELDFGTLAEVREPAYELVGRESGHVVVDLRPVTFVDSNGLGFLLSLHKRVQEKGSRLVLVSTSRHLEKLLRLSGLSAIMDVFESDSAATAALI